jgi:FKBP-type peptidyl-prolyl cis-trans isomerase
VRYDKQRVTFLIDTRPFAGYGDDGRQPNIPGKATLHFDIELQKLIKRDEL